MNFQSVNHVLFWPVMSIYIVVCFVWAVLIIGAWAGSLSQAPQWLKWAALRREIADAIMKPLRRELVTLVATIGLVAAGVVQGAILTSNYSRSAATLLSFVGGSTTPSSVREGISTLADLPGKYQRTLGAYREFLRSDGQPNLELISQKLPPEDDRSAFDLRLLGLSYDTLAEQMPMPQDNALRKEYFQKAKGYYSAALESAKKNPQEDATVEARTRFASALRSNVAGIDLSLGEMDDNKELLIAARDAYTHLRAETGLPGALLNLAGVHSLLGKHDEAEYRKAEQVLASAVGDRRLSRDEKAFIRNSALDLERMHELRALAAYVKRKRGLEWPVFVNGLFARQATPVQKM